MHQITTRRAAALLAFATLGAAPVIAAAAYPDHPVRIIVPFGAGGSADVYARVLAQQLGAQFKQSFIVEDRPGAGAVIGTEYVAKSAPDGYTLLMMSNTQTVNESLVKNKPYELMRDFVAVAPVNEAPLVLVTREALPVQNLAQLIALAKKEPGKLNFASSGTGTPYHMAGAYFDSLAGVNIVHIPYKSSGAARTDVLGGQVDMMFDSVATMTDLISSKRVRAIATTGKTRSNVLPDVPTVAEAGLPGYTATIWLGLMAPKATPAAVVNVLNQQISAIVSRKDIVDVWAQSGTTPMKMSPATFTRFLQDDIARQRKIVQTAHITVQ